MKTVTTYCTRQLLQIVGHPTLSVAPPPPIFPRSEEDGPFLSVAPEDYKPEIQRLVREMKDLYCTVACSSCQACTSSDPVPGSCQQLIHIIRFVKYCSAIKGKKLSQLIAKLNLEPKTGSELKSLIEDLQPIRRLVEASVLRQNRGRSPIGKPKKLEGKSRRTRLRMIIAMARAKYGYLPGRNLEVVVRAMSHDVSAIGQQLRADLIECVLQEAGRTEDSWDDASLGWGDAMLVLIYAIAVRRYGYIPQALRNDANGAIWSDIHLANSFVDMGALKNALDLAVEFVGAS